MENIQLQGNCISRWMRSTLVLGIIFAIFFSTGCATQQELDKIQQDLGTQIGKIKTENRAIGSQVEDAKTAISDSQAMIAQQKADMAKMRSDLASLNQHFKLLREHDLTSLYGKNEVAEKRISDLERAIKSNGINFGDSDQKIADLESELRALKEIVKRNETEKDRVLERGVEENQGLKSKGVTAEEALRSFLDFSEEKKNISAYFQACFKNDWTSPLEYEHLTKNEAYFKIDQLIAIHENSALTWENCHKNLKERMTRLWDRWNGDLKHLRNTIGYTDSKFQTAMTLAEKSLKGFQTVIDEAYPRIIQIQNLLSEYFKSLKYYQPNVENFPITIPEKINKLEREVFQSLKKQTKGALDDIQLAYTLYPSEKNALRVSNMEILVGLYDGINIFNEEDSRNYDQKFSDFQKEIELAKFRTHQISNDPKLKQIDISLIKDYAVILEDIGKLEEIMWFFKKLDESSLGNFQPQSSPMPNQKEEDSLLNFMNLLEKIEAKLLFLDNKINSRNFGEFKNYRHEIN